MPNNIKIAIIGLGYVGLPLYFLFKKKYETYGFDTDIKKIGELKNNFDSKKQVPKYLFKKFKKHFFSNNINNIHDANFFIVTVPTPIFKNNKPNLNYLISASKLISSVIKKNDIIVYESTVYPGVTRNVCIPIIEKKSGLKINKDFYVGYSPERVNPGDNLHKIQNVTKIISSSNKSSLTNIEKVYKKVIKSKLHKADSIEIAEAAKVIENSQRDVNIAFVNEISIILDKLQIDTKKVLEAASTKWNFQKFTPGLVGGHCISIDPYYLSFLANKNNLDADVILSGRKINEFMSKYYANMIISKLKYNKKKLSRSSILLLGFAFKENCTDFRNSKVIDLYKYLCNKKINVDIHDPIVSKKTVESELGIKIYNKFINKKYDAIILTVKHQFYKKIGKKNILNMGKNNFYFLDIKNFL